jgi:hypothetical protein
MDLKFLKERYDFELQRKEQLTSALTLPVGVLSGLGGLMAAMVRSFPNKTLWLTVPFAVAFALDVVAFFVCLVYPARTYHRQKYLYLPLLKELEEWEQAFREFNNYAVATDDIEETFSTHLRERIIEAADRNSGNNEYRSGLLHRARVALFAVLICTTAAGVLYVGTGTWQSSSSRRTRDALRIAATRTAVMFRPTWRSTS